MPCILVIVNPSSAIFSPSCHHHFYLSLSLIENQGDGFILYRCHQLKVLQCFSLFFALAAEHSEMFGSSGMDRLVTEDSHNSKLGWDDELCFILYSDS
jgi:hypothetical protein